MELIALTIFTVIVAVFVGWTIHSNMSFNEKAKEMDAKLDAFAKKHGIDL